MSTSRESRCVGCGSKELEEFMSFEGVPIHVCVLWQSEEEARSCPRGDLRLSFCLACGMIANTSFDPAGLEYSESYENALQFSGVYEDYMRGYAHELGQRYDLRGKSILEIGCGDGRFLAMLSDVGDNEGVGFEPAFSGDRETLGRRVRIVRDYYSSARATEPVDLVVCRQVLEHVANPREFLEDVRRALKAGGRSAVEFEVPNGELTLREIAVWDVIYEHHLYFTESSLRRLFASCGFDVTHVSSVYGGQFLTIGATAANRPTGPEQPVPADLESARRRTHRFGELHTKRVTEWSRNLQMATRSDRRVALWGAGARGVSFLNLADPDDTVGCVVDVNPRKHGKFLPGTGQQVMLPSTLQAYDPDLVIVMNPLYKAEIEGALAELKVDAELCVA